jgi:transcriptional regulator of acetoin/glycerol metabolism
VRQLEDELANLSFRAEEGIITKALAERSLSSPGLSDASPGVCLGVDRFDDLLRVQEQQQLAFIERAIELERGNIAAAARRLNMDRVRLYKTRKKLAGRLATS